MTLGDPLQAEAKAALAEDSAVSTEIETSISDEKHARPSESENPSEAPDAAFDEDAEAREDDAWMDACRTETDDDDPFAPQPEAVKAYESDLKASDPQDEDADSDNETAAADMADAESAIEKTGGDAMSKFGNAIGALAERDEDLDDRAFEYAAEVASPSKSRDAAVAPHIAAAERELERSKSSGPLDIFDRIAQAAESQFDESRGSTAKRVSELVDDRRVGTKRWTPSKTMKQRMEKLEAARAAASGSSAPVEAVAEPVRSEASAAEAPEIIAASAPASSAAVMVTPKDQQTERKAKAVPEATPEPAPMSEEQKVVISRRDRQADASENTETESSGATEAEGEEELDADGLRVIPGARGRRRDRARKSRLDEDFEKIFDDEGKPSINSLRRKLRSSAAAEEGAEGAAAPVAAAAFTEEQFGADSAEAPKKSLFARLFKSKTDKGADGSADAIDEEEMVAAFEADETALDDRLDFDTGDEEDWQTAMNNQKKQRAIALPIIGAGAAIFLGGLGFFAYKFFAG